MEPFSGQRGGRYRPKVLTRAPRCIPDERFDALFAQLGSHRDRALVALWVSTGARAWELLGAAAADVDPGQQLITVIRKGTRVPQPLPASPDAFVWLRLYQAQLAGLVPSGRDEPLWWTLRRPFRRLGYDAARAMFHRANAALGSNWSLHDLRHSAAYRMLADRGLVISAGKMSGLWSGRPHTVRLDELDVICTVPGCRVEELLTPEPEGVAKPAPAAEDRTLTAGQAHPITPRTRTGRSLPPR